MRRVIEKVEIKEPPIEQLSKKRSCARRACLTSCGCMVLVILISLLLLKFTLGPKTRELKDLPEVFAQTVPLYAADDIEKIYITEGSERNRGAEYAAFLPKLFISPIVVALNKETEVIETLGSTSSTIAAGDASFWRRFVAFMRTPVADHRDLYKLEWEVLDADPEFIFKFYRSKLEENGFTVEAVSVSERAYQFSFSKKTIDGVLYIEDFDETKATDFVSLTITVGDGT